MTGAAGPPTRLIVRDAHAASLTRARWRRRARRWSPATFAEMQAHTRSLTGPERLEVFEALPASVQARMWREVARSIDAERERETIAPAEAPV